MFDIHAIMHGLSQKRKVFHSEADFRLALASHICNSSAGSVVRTDHRFSSKKTKPIDIWFPSTGIVIELTHRLQRLEVISDGVTYDLASHGAHDQGRYDFVSSIQTIERAQSAGYGVKRGFSVLLTNDFEYWDSPRIGWENTFDADFRIREDNVLSGSLRWHPEASEGTTRGVTEPVNLNGSYRLRWRHYYDLDASKYSRFRYLAVEVGN